MHSQNQPQSNEIKFFKSSLILMVLQYCAAILTITLLKSELSPVFDFLKNFSFYSIIFIVPIIVYVKIALKESLSKYLCLNLQKIYIGLLSALFMLAIFFISHGFVFDIQPKGVALYYAVAGAVFAGIFEECAFRGFYLNILTRKIGFIKANLIVSVLFAGLHFNQIASIGIFQGIMLFIFSLFVGYLMDYTKSLTNVIIVHAVYNILHILF